LIVATIIVHKITTSRGIDKGQFLVYKSFKVT